MSDMQTKLDAEFDAWFSRLQALTDEPLDPEDWPERWFDGYTPEEALEDGPEDYDGPWTPPSLKAALLAEPAREKGDRT